MRGKSHRYLGEFLVRQYMPGIPRSCVRAFLLGCIQPDRNPLTYLKGSLRRQWLRGHNFENAKRYICRTVSRLEKKQSWSILDYYTLGKLIHYTADAFTYAHNECFGTDLRQHQVYEAALQDHFLDYLGSHPEIKIQTFRSAREAIYSYHRTYSRSSQGIKTDSYFVLTACCSVLSILFPCQIRQPMQQLD